MKKEFIFLVSYFSLISQLAFGDVKYSYNSPTIGSFSETEFDKYEALKNAVELCVNRSLAFLERTNLAPLSEPKYSEIIDLCTSQPWTFQKI